MEEKPQEKIPLEEISEKQPEEGLTNPFIDKEESEEEDLQSMLNLPRYQQTDSRRIPDEREPQIVKKKLELTY